MMLHKENIEIPGPLFIFGVLVLATTVAYMLTTMPEAIPPIVQGENEMILYVLFGQRKESYEGQYAPEVLACWDEFSADENPGGWEQACEEAIASCGDDMFSTRVVHVRVNGDKIRNLLVGVPAVDGAVENGP